ncbi:MAG: hypothetical protein ACRD2P_19015 [Terriglobia bacterium]
MPETVAVPYGAKPQSFGKKIQLDTAMYGVQSVGALPKTDGYSFKSFNINMIL